VTTGFSQGATGDRTFWAQWAPTVYNITYDNTFNATNPNVTTFTIENNVSLAGLTGRIGYTFVKWLEDDADGDETTGSDAGTIGNKTFWRYGIRSRTTSHTATRSV
jgi:hypothetical protein